MRAINEDRIYSIEWGTLLKISYFFISRVRITSYNVCYTKLLRYILMQRPVAFIPKQIPDSHPDLSDIVQKKRFAVTLSVLAFLLIAPSGYLLLLIGNPGEMVSIEPLGGYLPPTLPLVVGGTAGISIYLYFSSIPYKKIRDRIKQMELEFADSLFVLGRRISEGKAPEEAFAHTSRTMSYNFV